MSDERAAEIREVTLGARRIGRSGRSAVTGLLMLGSLAIAAGGVIAPGVDLAAWRLRPSAADGSRLIDDGNYAPAVRTLLNVVAVAPNDARAHYYLGLAYARLGVRTGALNQLAGAVHLAPREALMHDGLGQTLRETGDASSALGEFEEATRLAPSEPRYLVHVAGLLLDQGNALAAAERLRQAPRLRPRSAGIHLLLAAALRRAGDPQGMVHEYREVSRLAGDGPLGEIAQLELHERRSR